MTFNNVRPDTLDMNRRKIALLAIAFSAFGYLVYYSIVFSEQAYYHAGVELALEEEGFRIQRVANASSAEAAGLSAGMLVVSINGRDSAGLYALSKRDMGTFLNITGRLFSLGKAMEFRVASGEVYHFEIKPLPWVERTRFMSRTVILDIAVGVGFIVLGLFFLFIGRGKPALLWFFPFSVGAGVAIASSYFIAFWAINFIKLRFFMLDIAGVIACVSLIAFIRRFPVRRALSFPWGATLSALVLLVKYSAQAFGWLKPYGISVYFIHVYIIVSLAYVFVLIIYQYRLSGAEGQVRLRWVFSGITLSLLPTLAYLISLIVRSSLLIYNQNLFNNLASVSLLLFPLFIGLAVVKYNLFDIDRFLNRFVVIALLGVIAAAFYALSFYLFIRADLGPYSFLSFMAAALLSPWLYARLNNFVSAFFAKRYKNEKQILDELENELVGVQKTHDVYPIVSAALVSAFEPSSIAFVRRKSAIQETLYRYEALGSTNVGLNKTFKLSEKDGAEFSLLIGKKRDGESYSKEDYRLIREAANQVAKALEKCELYGNLQTSLLNESLAQRTVILTLAKLTEYRDKETGRHLERIQEYSRLLAKRMKELSIGGGYITNKYIDALCLSSVLHDIGKVGIPDHILRKPGELTMEEFELMKRHTEIGGRVLEQAEAMNPARSFLAIGKLIAYHHHERWDGSGYPAGLKREAIPLSARIVAIADVYDALRSDRPYKKAIAHEKAMEIIRNDSGTHFDPTLVEAFVSIEKLVRKVPR